MILLLSLACARPDPKLAQRLGTVMLEEEAALARVCAAARRRDIQELQEHWKNDAYAGHAATVPNGPAHAEAELSGVMQSRRRVRLRELMAGMLSALAERRGVNPTRASACVAVLDGGGSERECAAFLRDLRPRAALGMQQHLADEEPSVGGLVQSLEQVDWSPQVIGAAMGLSGLAAMGADAALQRLAITGAAKGLVGVLVGEAIAYSLDSAVRDLEESHLVDPMYVAGSACEVQDAERELHPVTARVLRRMVLRLDAPEKRPCGDGDGAPEGPRCYSMAWLYERSCEEDRRGCSRLARQVGVPEGDDAWTWLSPNLEGMAEDAEAQTQSALKGPAGGGLPAGVELMIEDTLEHCPDCGPLELAARLAGRQ